jgi:hypothetical protein
MPLRYAKISPLPSIFSDYSFRVLVNRDDRHLLAHAMAADFSVAPDSIILGLNGTKKTL